MTEEKQMILNMLKEGKITVEEASDLLEAIGDKKKADPSDLGSKITSTVDNIIKKATETLSNIDLDSAFDIDINNLNLKGEARSHKDMRIDDEINFVDIDLVNGDINIEKSSEPGIIVSADIYSKKENLEDYLSVEVKDDKVYIGENPEYSNTKASVKLSLSLGADLYEGLNIDTVNGRIEIADTDFNNLNIDTVNSRLILANSKSDIDIDSVNGKVDLKNIEGKIGIDNVNGGIYLTNVSGDLVEVDNVNGNIRVDGLRSDKLKADSNSGSIRIFDIKDTKDLDLDTGNGTIVVDTNDYNGKIRAFVESPSINAVEKYTNKIETSTGFEISTSQEEEDLKITAKTSHGKVSLR